MQEAARFRFAPEGADSAFGGRHRSGARGASTEFRDFRAYSPGDDLRLVDWRVLARTDRPYIRTFVHESESECHVFLDSSASMGFGEKLSKLDYASYFVGALSYLVVNGGDRVSLTLFQREVREFLPSRGTWGHLRGIVSALDRNLAKGSADLAGSLRKAFPLVRGRGCLVILSDFLDVGPTSDWFAAMSSYLGCGMRVHLIQVLDPEELDLRGEGVYRFQDAETGMEVEVDVASLRDRYRDAMDGHVRRIREFAAHRGMRHRLALTDQPHQQLFHGLAELR